MKFEAKTGTVFVTAEAADQWTGETWGREVQTVDGAELLVCTPTVSVKGSRKKVALRIKLSDKPALQAAVAQMHEQQAAAAQKHQADEAARKDRRQAVIDACPAGMVACTCNWRNGDLMAAEYKTINGGVDVMGSDTIDCAGEGIYYLPADKADAADAEEREQRAAEKQAEADRVESIKTTARETGEDQVLHSYTETREATEGGEKGEYMFAVTIRVRPDGTTYETAVNAY